MLETLVSLLPLAIGAALVPMHVMMVLLLLSSEDRPLLKASAFVAGMTAGRIGVATAFVLATNLSGEGALARRDSTAVLATLLTVLGIFMLIGAFRFWIMEDDPDAPPPKWMATVSRMSPLLAFGIGLGMMLMGAAMWAYNLSALGTIEDASLGQPRSSFTYLLYTLLAQALLWMPVALTIVAPVWAKGALASVNQWLTKNNRVIMIVVSLVFGLLFLYKGLTSLFG